MKKRVWIWEWLVPCFSATAGLAFPQTLSGPDSSAGKEEEQHLLRIWLRTSSCCQRLLHGLLMYDTPSWGLCHPQFILWQKARRMVHFQMLENLLMCIHFNIIRPCTSATTFPDGEVCWGLKKMPVFLAALLTMLVVFPEHQELCSKVCLLVFEVHWLLSYDLILFLCFPSKGQWNFF